MNKKIIGGICIVLLIVILPNVAAYADCTPTVCPDGTIDSGVICEGSTCIRQCSSQVCTNEWNQVFSNTFGFDVNGKREEEEFSQTYSPSDTSMCYNFTYQGPPDKIQKRRMRVIDDPSQDCDSEAIGGFFDATNKVNPWFSGMSGYLGFVDGKEVNYLLQIMRAHAEEDSDTAYHQEVTKREAIACAPTSQACALLGGTSSCDTDCYGRATQMYIQQGYYKQTGTPDQTLYDDKECDHEFVQSNRMLDAQFIVYESTMTEEVIEQSCERTHEAPSVANVHVEPANPIAGQNLTCIYDYTDPEHFAEQGSTYEWYKNNINQNINEQDLSSSYISPGDTWHCTVTPSDGLLTGAKKQSAQVTIGSTPREVHVEMHSEHVVLKEGYFGEELEVDFTDQLQNTLDSCTPDEEGYCEVELDISSQSSGTVRVQDVEVFMEPLTDTQKFFIKDSSSHVVAWFGNSGNVFIAGSLLENADYVVDGSELFTIKNDGGVSAAVTDDGDLFIAGVLLENQESISSIYEHDFVVRDGEDEIVIVVDEEGEMRIKGELDGGS